LLEPEVQLGDLDLVGEHGADDASDDDADDSESDDDNLGGAETFVRLTRLLSRD